MTQDTKTIDDHVADLMTAVHENDDEAGFAACCALGVHVVKQFERIADALERQTVILERLHGDKEQGA